MHNHAVDYIRMPTVACAVFLDDTSLELQQYWIPICTYQLSAYVRRILRLYGEFIESSPERVAYDISNKCRFC